MNLLRTSLLLFREASSENGRALDSLTNQIESALVSREGLLYEVGSREKNGSANFFFLPYILSLFCSGSNLYGERPGRHEQQ